jgi:cell division protease FtsH
LLEDHSEQLHVMADALMKYETINGSQIDQIMEGLEPDPPEGWQDSDSDVTEEKDDASDAANRNTIGGPAEQV